MKKPKDSELILCIDKKNLLKSLSPEIRREAEYILKGEHGLMPVTSNKIQIVWVHKCGYGREAILTVDNEGRKQFEKVGDLCKRQYNFLKINPKIVHGFVVHKQRPCGMTGDCWCGEFRTGDKITFAEDNITCDKCKKLMKGKNKK